MTILKTNHSPRRCEADGQGKSCDATKVIRAQGRNGCRQGVKASIPFTASAFAASLLRGALLLTFFFCVPVEGKATAADHSEGFGPPPCALGFMPALAEASAEQIGNSGITGIWWIGGALAALQIWALLKPAPPLHKQFTDRADHDKDIKEIKETLGGMKHDFESWSKSHYDARRRMHRKISHMSSAMAYLAGSLEARDPQTAHRLRDMINKVDEEGEDE